MTRLLPAILIVVVSMLALAPSSPAPHVEESVAPVRHVVLFKYKDGTPPETIRDIEQAFAALPDQIEAIKAFEWGTNVSPEGLDQGFTHCFLLTFADEAGRDAYLPHPAHKAFGGVVGPHLDKVLVIDYHATR